MKMRGTPRIYRLGSGFVRATSNGKFSVSEGVVPKFSAWQREEFPKMGQLAESLPGLRAAALFVLGRSTRQKEGWFMKPQEVAAKKNATWTGGNALVGRFYTSLTHHGGILATVGYGVFLVERIDVDCNILGNALVTVETMIAEGWRFFDHRSECNDAADRTRILAVTR